MGAVDAGGCAAGGVLIARFDFTAPYLVLAMISLALLPILWRNLAFDAKPVDGDRIDWGKITRTALRSPRIVAPTLFIVSVMSAGTLIFVTYADWLEREFAVNLGGLAQTAVMIGVAELIGEFLSGALSDRVNKKWFVLSTGAGIAAMCLIMPHAPTRMLALVGLFVYFVFFETTVVSTIPIFSELMPEARTVPLSLLALAVPIGQATGALLAPQITAIGGFVAVGQLAAVLMVVPGISFLALTRVEFGADAPEGIVD
ncbi:MAG: MFS transporter [Chloroflexota bacterium]